jgi:hypothetical protein
MFDRTSDNLARPGSPEAVRHLSEVSGIKFAKIAHAATASALGVRYFFWPHGLSILPRNYSRHPFPAARCMSKGAVRQARIAQPSASSGADADLPKAAMCLHDIGHARHGRGGKRASCADIAADIATARGTSPGAGRAALQPPLPGQRHKGTLLPRLTRGK